MSIEKSNSNMSIDRSNSKTPITQSNSKMSIAQSNSKMSVVQTNSKMSMSKSSSRLSDDYPCGARSKRDLVIELAMEDHTHLHPSSQPNKAIHNMHAGMNNYFFDILPTVHSPRIVNLNSEELPFRNQEHDIKAGDLYIFEKSYFGDLSDSVASVISENSIQSCPESNRARQTKASPQGFPKIPKPCQCASGSKVAMSPRRKLQTKQHIPKIEQATSSKSIGLQSSCDRNSKQRSKTVSRTGCKTPSRPSSRNASRPSSRKASKPPSRRRNGKPEKVHGSMSQGLPRPVVCNLLEQSKARVVSYKEQVRTVFKLNKDESKENLHYVSNAKQRNASVGNKRREPKDFVRPSSTKNHRQ